MKKINLELVLQEFTPNGGQEFFYKPSKGLNYLVWADEKYIDYLIGVYGEIPSRINPVQLNLVKDGEVVFQNIFFDNISTGVLEDILNDGGRCQVKVKGNKWYLGKNVFYGTTPSSFWYPNIVSRISGKFLEKRGYILVVPMT